MSSVAKLTITRAIPDETSSSWGEVWLSQDEPSGTLISAIDLATALSHILSDGDSVTSRAGLDSDGTYTTTVYIASSPASLAVSYGIGPGEIISETHSLRATSQLITFSMTDTATLSWPPDAIIAKTWQGSCYNSDGEVVPSPLVTVDGVSLELSEAVYGTLMVTYTTTIRKIKVRIAALEGLTSCYFWATWNGGVRVMEVTPSSTASDALTDGDDTWSTTLNSIPNDDWAPPTASKDDKTINIDYCLQEVY